MKFVLLRPKAPEHSVVLWSPRHQHHPAIDWLLGKGLFIDQLIVCLLRTWSICLFLDLLNKLVWEQVWPLVLVKLTGQGGLGLWGDWGPFKIIPQHMSASNSSGKYVPSTRDLLVADRCIVSSINGPPINKISGLCFVVFSRIHLFFNNILFQIKSFDVFVQENHSRCLFRIEACAESLIQIHPLLKILVNSKVIQSDFFHWYPPKKLKYGKPRLGESTLT